MQLSYSDKAEPWDNAPIEAFHAIIKREWFSRFQPLVTYTVYFTISKKMRLKKSKPIMDECFHWLTTFPTLKGKLQEAVNYALNQKVSLMRALEDGRLQLSNNLAEQSIKTLVIGRKNYLFSDSEKEAQANAIAYTLIETARANGLDPYQYLEHLFTHLPHLVFKRKPELLESFLPWALKLST